MTRRLPLLLGALPDEGETPALTGLEAALVGDRPAPQPAPTLPPSVEAAAEALCDKLDALGASPAFTGVFALAGNHGVPYVGLTWVEELAAVRAALSSARGARGGE